MLKNYLKIALRIFSQNKTQTFIKIFGLGIALGAGITIFSWIKFELSYDDFHKDSGQIYRLVIEDQSVTAPPGYKLILNNIPEIENSVRLFNAGFLGEKKKVAYKDKIFTNDAIYYADDEFFKIFSFPLLRGNPENVLDKNNAAVITESMAMKYFGNEDPVGKTLTLSGRNELEVTGVVKDIPANSHFHFDMLITLKNQQWWNLINETRFGSMWIFPTYLKMRKDANPEIVRSKIEQLLQPFRDKPEKTDFQKLKDIHLYSSYKRELEANGDINYIYLFSIIGILIIIMSCVNYINLTTTIAFKRSKEIGIRKVIGAEKQQIIMQMVGESILISICAFLLSLVLIEIFKPLFTAITGVNFFKGILSEGYIVLLSFIFTVLLGLLTGLFPSIVLAKFKIINSIKSGNTGLKRNSKLRGAFVVFQFSISIALIGCSLIVFNQMQYIKNKKLGFDKNQVLVLNLGHDKIVGKIDVLRNSLLSNPNISQVTSGSQLPSQITTMEGVNTNDGKRHDSYFISVDKQFFKALDINIKKGKEQIENIVPDETQDMTTYGNKFVVNQKFLDEAGIKIEDTENQPLVIRHGNMLPGPIIGVVDDFHFESLHSVIHPLVFEFSPKKEWVNTYLMIKINAGNIPESINYIKNEWEKISKGLPFEYSFLDEEYNSLYKNETRTGSLFAVFTIISIFIIILGLIGLIMFFTAQKTKEIGIRKVLGATSGSILFLLSRKFILWIIIADIIAFPAAWYFMNKWLQNFAYRVDVNWWLFLISGLIALIISLVTVSFQAIKAATANPIKSLRYE
jgi:putative ABC transport system permease protein